MTVRQLREMLGISRQLAYDLINDGELQAIKIGNSFKIPKVSVINFVTEEKKEVKSLTRLFLSAIPPSSAPRPDTVRLR